MNDDEHWMSVCLALAEKLKREKCRWRSVVLDGKVIGEATTLVRKVVIPPHMPKSTH